MKRFIYILCSLFAGPLWAQPKEVVGKPLADGARATTEFKADKITVYRNEGIAIVNLKGETVYSGIKAPRKGFSRYFSIEKGVFFADEDNVIVLKDLSGHTLGGLRFQEFQPFITDNTLVRLANTPAGQSTFAYIDLSGKEIVRFDGKRYVGVTQTNSSIPSSDKFAASSMFLSVSDFPPFSEGMTTIKDFSTDKVGFIDKQFKLVIPAKFHDASRFSEGLSAVKDENGNWGYITKAGEQVIPFSYSIRPSDFCSGLAKVRSKTGLYGFIDHRNNVVIQPIYRHASNFYKGHALVREDYNSPTRLIDSAGNVLCEFPKDVSYIDNASESAGISGRDKGEKPFYVSETLKQLVDYGKGIFTQGLRYGLVDIKGNIVLDFKYTLLSDYHDGMMFVHLSEFIDGSTQHTYGIVDDAGQLLLKIVDSAF